MRRVPSLRILFITALLAALVTAAPAQGALKRCSLAGKERKLGATYVTSLKVSGISCRSAEGIVKAFHKCRRANGGADGRCTKRVSGFKCSESRFNRISTQYDAKVSCRRTGKRIDFTYTQFT